MASPKTTHALPPKTKVQCALSQIGGEIEDQPLRSSSLARIMRETFRGSDADGAWDWRMTIVFKPDIDAGQIYLALLAFGGRDWMKLASARKAFSE